MRIRSMTATFGKLDHETLTLEPGLNIIEAPNEWGKSTWCAFLVTMLYGLDTRAKSTKTALADKERYAPWSGRPMSGRMELRWHGRDITIERWTRGRTPLGEFRAYETDTGLAVQELTAGNCGETLLGVEKSVFLRSGFLRLPDLPVTPDEFLRRRLNALVTTGDESDTAGDLDRKLRELKNRCRHNRTGLIPQAQAELAELEVRQAELEHLKAQSIQLRRELDEVRDFRRDLLNHRSNLEYQDAQRDARQVEEARRSMEHLRQVHEDRQRRCAWIPETMDLEHIRRQAAILDQQKQKLLAELDDPSPREEPPAAPEVFRGLTPEEAMAQAATDADRTDRLRNLGARPSWIPALTALALILLGFGLWTGSVPWGWLPLLPGLALLAWASLRLYRDSCRRTAARAEIQALEARYGSADPRNWIAQAEEYRARSQDYAGALERASRKRQELAGRIHDLDQQIQALCAPLSVKELDRALECRRTLHAAEADLRHAEHHWQENGPAGTASPVRGHADLYRRPDRTALRRSRRPLPSAAGGAQPL